MFVFFFSSWVLGNPVRLLRTEVEVGVRHFIRRIRFYLHSGQMTVSLTVSKIPMYPENLGTWQGYDLARSEISGDLLSLICGTEYWESMSWEYISYMQPRVGERKKKEKVNYHIDRHDDTRCTIVTDPMLRSEVEHLEKRVKEGSFSILVRHRGPKVRRKEMLTKGSTSDHNYYTVRKSTG